MPSDHCCGPWRWEELVEEVKMSRRSELRPLGSLEASGSLSAELRYLTIPPNIKAAAAKKLGLSAIRPLISDGEGGAERADDFL